MKKDSDGFLEAENMSDWLILEALASRAELPLFICKKGETRFGKGIAPSVHFTRGWDEDYKEIISGVDVEYELPYEGTLFGNPCKEHVKAKVTVREEYDGSFEVHLRFGAYDQRPEFSLVGPDDYYAMLPWTAANAMTIQAIWDESKHEVHPLD